MEIKSLLTFDCFDHCKDSDASDAGVIALCVSAVNSADLKDQGSIPMNNP